MALELGDIVLLKDRVYKLIKSEIILGHYKPGDKINIVDIASQMNISCAPVREALSMLCKDGLVSLPPHKKPVVTETDVKDWAVSMELRKMLEPYVARLSVNSIPQAAIDEVRSQLNAVLNNPENMVAYIESDMAVHELLYIYCDSKLLSELLNVIKTYTTRIRYSIERSLDGSPESQRAVCIESTMEHVAIIDALDTRDPEKAEQAVKLHIDKYTKRSELSKTRASD